MTAEKKHEVREGDWTCPYCNDLQFGRNAVCRICATRKPTVGAKVIEREELRKGAERAGARRTDQVEVQRSNKELESFHQRDRDTEMKEQSVVTLKSRDDDWREHGWQEQGSSGRRGGDEWQGAYQSQTEVRGTGWSSRGGSHEGSQRSDLGMNWLCGACRTLNASTRRECKQCGEILGTHSRNWQQEARGSYASQPSSSSRDGGRDERGRSGAGSGQSRR